MTKNSAKHLDAIDGHATAHQIVVVNESVRNSKEVRGFCNIIGLEEKCNVLQESENRECQAAVVPFVGAMQAAIITELEEVSKVGEPEDEVIKFAGIDDEDGKGG